MKKRTDDTTKKPRSARRLGLKKEILRHLSADDLNNVAGGIGCGRTQPPGGGGCTRDC